MIEKHGFYIIKDEFFEIANDKYLRHNKGEDRPHYYCVRDSEDGFLWVIPLSKRVEKYKNIIKERESKNLPCDILHIAKLANGKESVFLIQDIFPITEEYIDREYTLFNKPYVLKNEKLIKIIERKANKIIGLLKKNIQYMPTKSNINSIIDKIKKHKL